MLGLVNNWVIYKIDEATIRRVKSYIPNSDDSLWGLVRSLGPRQALVSFTPMRRPVICAGRTAVAIALARIAQPSLATT